MTLIWATGTHQGRVRDNNQDSVYPGSDGRTDEGLLIAVADGMGGHVAGEIASRTALEAAVALDSATPSERILAGNDAVVAATDQDPRLRGMGTTLTLADVRPEGSFVLGHVGDSRAYLLRDGDLRQLTEDHTVVAEYLAAGKITEEHAAVHPQRSILTRAVGVTRHLQVDEIPERLQPGDRLLLCSDGLTGMVADDVIREQLSGRTPEESVWALIEAANRAGGYDNISIAIVLLEP